MDRFKLSPLRLVIALVSLLTAACAPHRVGAPLGSTDAAPPPAVTPGEQWTYRVRDAYTGLERGSETYRVAQVGADQITVNVTRNSSAADETQVYDRQWNWVRRPATNLQAFDYTPAYSAFVFPLTPGKTWRAHVTATDPADGRRFPVRIDAEVLGWERVKVPAGEFDAVRIRRTVYLDYWVLGVRGSSHIEEQDWYAPAVKQSVRREARSRYWSVLGESETGFVPVRSVRVRGGGKDDGGPRFVPDDWLVHELVSYSAR